MEAPRSGTIQLETVRGLFSPSSLRVDGVEGVQGQVAVLVPDHRQHHAGGNHGQPVAGEQPQVPGQRRLVLAGVALGRIGQRRHSFTRGFSTV